MMEKVKYLFFAIPLFVLLFMLREKLKPCFTEEDIGGARFLLYKSGAPVLRLEWNQFSSNDQERIICWVKELPERGRFAITDYAPGLRIISPKMMINIVEGKVIIDYNTKWLDCAGQIVCKRTEIDSAIFTLILNSMIENQNLELNKPEGAVE